MPPCGVPSQSLTPERRIVQAEGDNKILFRKMVGQWPIGSKCLQGRFGSVVKRLMPFGLDNLHGFDPAVLANDHVFSGTEDISDLPTEMVDRLEHYFLTYKMVPGHTKTVAIDERYGRGRAHDVVRASMADYRNEIVG